MSHNAFGASKVTFRPLEVGEERKITGVTLESGGIGLQLPLPSSYQIEPDRALFAISFRAVPQSGNLIPLDIRLAIAGTGSHCGMYITNYSRTLNGYASNCLNGGATISTGACYVHVKSSTVSKSLVYNDITANNVFTMQPNVQYLFEGSVNCVDTTDNANFIRINGKRTTLNLTSAVDTAAPNQIYNNFMLISISTSSTIPIDVYINNVLGTWANQGLANPDDDMLEPCVDYTTADFYYPRPAYWLINLNSPVGAYMNVGNVPGQWSLGVSKVGMSLVKKPPTLNKLTGTQYRTLKFFAPNDYSGGCATYISRKSFSGNKKRMGIIIAKPAILSNGDGSFGASLLFADSGSLTNHKQDTADRLSRSGDKVRLFTSSYTTSFNELYNDRDSDYGDVTSAFVFGMWLTDESSAMTKYYIFQRGGSHRTSYVSTVSSSGVVLPYECVVFMPLSGTNKSSETTNVYKEILYMSYIDPDMIAAHPEIPWDDRNSMRAYFMDIPTGKLVKNFETCIPGVVQKVVLNPNRYRGIGLSTNDSPELAYFTPITINGTAVPNPLTHAEYVNYEGDIILKP